MSEDPIGFLSGDTNHYRYVSSQPTSVTDPTGKNGLGRIIGIIVIGSVIGKGADSCTKSEPVVDDSRRKDKKICEEEKEKQLDDCDKGLNSKEICESIKKKRCD